MVSRVGDSLSATELASGTLISASDDWQAESAVRAMTEPLNANGVPQVDEITAARG